MLPNSYEPHIMDPKFPILFHFDTVKKLHSWFVPHWHENIELLLITHGQAKVVSDTITAYAREGDLVVIPSNQIHIISAETAVVQYYCLIVSKSFCESLGLGLEDKELGLISRDKIHRDVFETIISESNSQLLHYKTRIMGLVLLLLTGLFRNAGDLAREGTGSKKATNSNIVRQTMEYINLNYSKNFSVDRLAASLGFSKYYLCHVFKSATKKTIVEYLNYVRCIHARRLLVTTNCDVKTAAAQCGFDNASYFSRKYKEMIGCLPTDTLGSKEGLNIR